MSSHKLGLYIKQLINNSNESITALARDSNLSRETLYKLQRGEIKEPKIETLIAISRALDVPLSNFVDILYKNQGLSRYIQTDSTLVDLELTSRLQINKDDICFLDDETYPDNSTVPVNSTFTKVWKIQNTGSTHWRKRKLICVDDDIQISSKSDNFSQPLTQRGLIPTKLSVPIPDTAPQEEVSIRVKFKAPAFPCSTISYWKMVDQHIVFCYPDIEGLSCHVRVVVK